jgi:thioredoxin 1
MGKKKLIKMIIPIFIVIAIAGIWIFKNISSASVDSVLPNDHEDFALETDSIDLDALTAYGLPIIIDFGSDSCIPCQQMAPVLKTMNTDMQGKAIIQFVDVWKYSEAADGFPIQVIPTQIFINADGNPYVPGGDAEVEFTTYIDKETGEHAFTVHQGGLTEDQMRTILADMGVTE